LTIPLILQHLPVYVTMYCSTSQMRLCRCCNAPAAQLRLEETRLCRAVSAQHNSQLLGEMMTLHRFKDLPTPTHHEHERSVALNPNSPLGRSLNCGYAVSSLTDVIRTEADNCPSGICGDNYEFLATLDPSFEGFHAFRGYVNTAPLINNRLAVVRAP
jgi:hypothetical protein